MLQVLSRTRGSQDVDLYAVGFEDGGCGVRGRVVAQGDYYWPG